MMNAECEPVAKNEPRNDMRAVNSLLPAAALAMSRSVVQGLANPETYLYYPHKTVATAQRLSQLAIPSQIELVA